MIQLDSGDTLQAVAATTAVIGCKVFGDFRAGPVGGTVTNSYKPLFKGVLTNAVAPLITIGSNQQALVKTIELQNLSALSVVVSFYLTGTTDPARFKTLTIPANGSADYEDGRGWAIYDSNGIPIVSTINSLDGDVVGPPDINKVYGPTWSGAVNTIGAVTSTSAEHVVDSRAVPAGDIIVDYLLVLTVRAAITGTNGNKNLRLCIAEDSAHSYLATFDATVEGIVCARFTVPAKTGVVQTGITEVDLNNNANWFIDRQTAIAVDFTAASTWQARAWVANALDSITIDTVDLQVERKRP